MKIAISGAAGCGKTTLAGALAARLGVPLVPESYEDFFDDQGKFIKPDSRLARTIAEVLEAKRRMESEAGDFVTDRCPVDLFHLWLTQRFFTQATLTEAFERKCREYAGRYDALVIPPWGAVPLVQLDPETTRRRRNMNPWLHFGNHAMLLGIALHWLPARRIIGIPADARSTGEQVDFVLRALEERGLGKQNAEAGR